MCGLVMLGIVWMCFNSLVVYVWLVVWLGFVICMLIGVGVLKLRIWFMMLVGRNENVMFGNVCGNMVCNCFM